MPIVTRRTHRQHHYHSNGRDYLASLLDWPSATILENFLRSTSVRPHLQHWIRLCYETPHRFHEAVEWINTGPKGYYYHPGDLEEDLLLECLSGWMEGMREVEAYGFMGEVLCIAFHSLAFRGKDSCYWGIIVGESKKAQVAWENGREAWEEAFGEPFPTAEEEEVMDVESEVSGSEVGSEGMAKTSSELSDVLTAVDEPESPGTNALLREAAVEELLSPVNSDTGIMAWRAGVEKLNPDLAQFDELAAILNQPNDESERVELSEPITPVSVGKVRRGIKRPDLDARGSGLATPRSLVVGGRVLRARK
nr:hypothetical protein B0A51_08914 [Rachicladosporium sp. CCFEE 5018]